MLDMLDITHNRTGRLSPAQYHTLHAVRRVWILLSVLLVVVIGALVFTALVEVWIAWLPLIFWLWLLRNAPLKWRAINRDLNMGAVDFVEGLARYDFSLSPGMIRVMRYHLHIGASRFRVTKDILFSFRNQSNYRAYFAPQSGVFLGAVPLHEAETKEPSSEQFSLFTERELELLKLIAAGYSNKEIAARLHLSTNTIKMYNSQLYQKLNVQRRTEAVARAREMGIL